MADTFNVELNFGPWDVGVLQLEGITLSFRTILMAGGSTVSYYNVLLPANFFSTPQGVDPAPEWTYNSSILRYMPMVIENPIVFGESTDYQGSVIHAKIANTPSSSRLVTMDNELHYDLNRDSFLTPGVPLTESIQLTTPGKIRIFGWDLGGYKMTISRAVDCYLEGVRSDALGIAIEDDALNVAGDGIGDLAATLAQLQAARSRYTIQNYYATNLKGTNKAHAAKNTLLAPITTNAAKEARIQLAQAPTTPVVVGNDVIVGNTVYAGQVRNLNDFNKTWTVKSITTQTDFVCEITVTTNSAYKTSVPASAATDNTQGSIWVMGAGTGNHADPLQHVTTADRLSKEVRVHNFFGGGNYVGTILQNVLNRLISNWSYEFQHADPDVWPTDDGSEAIRNGSQAAIDGKGYAEYYNLFAEIRPVWDIDLQVSPNSQTGQNGVPISTTAYGTARNAITYNRPEFRGGIVEGLVPAEFHRTNLLAYSEDFSNAYWQKYNLAITAGQVILNRPAFFADNTPNVNSYLIPVAGAGILLNSSTTYTRWVYAKAVSGNGFLAFEYNTGAVGGAAFFNLLTGVATPGAAGTASMRDMGDGVWLCAHTFTTAATGSRRSDTCYVGAYGSTPTPTRILMTGAQLELGNKATDYIPTTTAARTVTRFSDYDALGFGYIQDNTRYYGYTPPLASHITDIVFEGASSNIPESIVGGEAIGTFRTVHTLGDHPGIIDYTIVANNVLANQLYWHGRRLVRGKTRFSYTGTPGNTLQITVRATWRGTSEFYEKAFSFPIIDDVPASGMTLATPALGAAVVNTAPVSPQTYAAMAVGTAATNRFVLAFAANWFSSDNRTQGTTATIGGVSAPKTVGKRCLVTNGNWLETSMYVAAVPTGTTADVIITTSGSSTAGAVATIPLADLDTGEPFSTSAVNTDAVGGTVQFTMDIAAGGAAVFGCGYATITGNNKRFSTALITSGSLITVYVRCTTSGGTAVWERSPDGTAWTTTGITSLHDTAVEPSGGSGTVMIGASFAPR